MLFLRIINLFYFSVQGRIFVSLFLYFRVVLATILRFGRIFARYLLLSLRWIFITRWIGHLGRWLALWRGLLSTVRLRTFRWRLLSPRRCLRWWYLTLRWIESLRCLKFCSCWLLWHLQFSSLRIATNLLLHLDIWLFFLLLNLLGSWIILQLAVLLIFLSQWIVADLGLRHLSFRRALLVFYFGWVFLKTHFFSSFWRFLAPRKGSGWLCEEFAGRMPRGSRLLWLAIPLAITIQGRSLLPDTLEVFNILIDIIVIFNASRHLFRGGCCLAVFRGLACGRDLRLYGGDDLPNFNFWVILIQDISVGLLHINLFAVGSVAHRHLREVVILYIWEWFGALPDNGLVSLLLVWDRVVRLL